MVFFIFSFLATLFGGITAKNIVVFAPGVNLAVNNPFAGILEFWPFIVGLVLALLVVMWIQNFRIMQKKKKNPSLRGRTPSMVTMGFITVFALILLAAPYYVENMTGQQTGMEESAAPAEQSEMVLTVHGMDCGGCEALVNRRVGALEGVENVVASHQREEVVIVYDKDKVDLMLIAQVIEESGYTVVME